MKIDFETSLYQTRNDLTPLEFVAVIDEYMGQKADLATISAHLMYVFPAIPKGILSRIRSMERSDQSMTQISGMLVPYFEKTRHNTVVIELQSMLPEKPSVLARRLRTILGEKEFGSMYLLNYFVEAFNVPLEKMTEVFRWSESGSNPMSDERFNAILSVYFDISIRAEVVVGLRERGGLGPLKARAWVKKQLSDEDEWIKYFQLAFRALPYSVVEQIEAMNDSELEGRLGPLLDMDSNQK